LARRIHAAGRPLVLAVTGGGSKAISGLVTVPGASRSVLEALVPYSEPALAAFLGGKPDHACSGATARAMAMAAYVRAIAYAPAGAHAVGIGVTAGLATERAKLGAHRIHAAWQTADATAAVSVELAKGQRSRQQEEHLAAALVLNLVAEACDVSERLAVDLLPLERIEREAKQAPTEWQNLLAGRIASVGFRLPENFERGGKLIFPGAFNPCHAAHREMARLAERQLQRKAVFELSIINAAKPPLDFLEIDRRVAQFADDEPLLLTRAPTFVEKARLFPQAVFIVGADTAARIADPKYYAGGAAGMAEAIQQIRNQQGALLVFGRLIEGKFRTLGDLNLPPALAEICTEMGEDVFRADLSSSSLRGLQTDKVSGAPAAKLQ
jgi:nicotinamide mononucleotide (NMN) deamidase PncC